MGLYLRSIAFSASVGVFVRPLCFPPVVARFWGIVRGLVCFGGCAFPLVMRSRLKLSLVLRFRGVGCVLDRVRAFDALAGGFGTVVVFGLFCRWF